MPSTAPVSAQPRLSDEDAGFAPAPGLSARLSTMASRLPGWLLAGLTFIYLTLFGFNSLTRTRDFTPDSLNYVNVARNILAGRGITQPTLGFNQTRFTVTAELPVPFTAQAPLYPLAIAWVSAAGIDPADAALLIPVAAYGALLGLSFFLLGVLYDERTAWLALAALLLCEPLRHVAVFAWNESLALTLMLPSLLWLACERRREDARHLLGAGVLAGLAFATRYALLPVCATGAMFLLWRGPGWRRGLRSAGLFVAGFAVPSSVVLGRNLLLTGSLLPTANPSAVNLWQNLAALFWVLGGENLGLCRPTLETGLLASAVAVIGGALYFQGSPWRAVRETLGSHGRGVLTLWVLIYLCYLVALRSRSHFDPIDTRLLAPASVVLTVLGAALVGQACRPLPPALGKWFVLAALCFVGSREASTALLTPSLRADQAAPLSPRLAWLAQSTTDQDLIIGDNTVDVPFCLGRPATISFSVYPYTDHASYDHVIAYVRRHRALYRRVYLILRSDDSNQEQWRARYGNFFADLMFGHADKYPGVTFSAKLKDALVYELDSLTG